MVICTLFSFTFVYYERRICEWTIQSGNSKLIDQSGLVFDLNFDQKSSDQTIYRSNGMIIDMVFLLRIENFNNDILLDSIIKCLRVLDFEQWTYAPNQM